MKALEFFLTLLLAVSACQAERTRKELPCQLSWSNSSVSNLVIPEDTVKIQPVGDSKQYIIRGKFDGDDTYFIGRYDDNDNVKKIFLPFFGDKDENSTFADSFDFLVNPHECTSEWVENPTTEDQKFLVPNLGRSGNDIVGKRMSPSREWYPGHVDQKNGKVYITTTEGSTGTEEFNNYFVLLSYSRGIEMDVTDLIFASDPFEGETDFAGMDEIHNQGPGEVSVTLNHKKTIKETYTIQIKKTWTSTYTETIRTRILWWGRTKTYTHTTTRTETETYTTIEENEFAVSQLVTVPAFTSIQACSLIKLTENKAIDYSATVQYSARGMDPEEVVEILKQDSIEAEVLNGKVIAKTPMTGEFQASTALNTEFRTAPYGSGMNGCTAQALKSRPWNKLSIIAP